MFSSMSSGDDQWPQSEIRSSGRRTAASSSSSSAPAKGKQATTSSNQSIAAAQLARGRSPSPLPPLVRAGAPHDRILRPLHAPPTSTRKIGDLLGGWKGKGKGKSSDHSVATAGPGGLTVPSSNSLEATGWNQQPRFGALNESSPLLSPHPRKGVGTGGAKLTAQNLAAGSASNTYLAMEGTRRLSPLGISSDRNRPTGLLLGQSPSTASKLSSTAARGGRSWYMDLFRPTRERVDEIMDSWWKRHAVLTVFPCLIVSRLQSELPDERVMLTAPGLARCPRQVWFWCAVPFPKSHPDSPNRPWCDATPDAPWCRDGVTWHSSPTASSPATNPHLADADANFWFFLLFYYGLYAAVALVYVTQLFSLYRLNWWPQTLGAKTSYSIFWLLSISAAYMLHHFRWDSLMSGPGRPSKGQPVGEDSLEKASIYQAAATTLSTLTRLVAPSGDDDDADDDDIQWQRKTLWVGLAFATMAMPALVCLVGLRRSGRQSYRHSLTEAQKTFLERQLAKRIPASYIRYLWFISTIGLSLVALIAGQGYASVYLSTLPHTGLDGTAYVTFWMMTVNLLSVISTWILEEKVRSRALLFANKYYYFLVYFIFYRNLFARLRSLDQFALIQLASSFWVCVWYPLTMTSWAHRITQYFSPHPKSWEEYAESIGLAFYLRNLAQNTTMLAFLGWTSLLHFGSNKNLYPFFSFNNNNLINSPPSDSSDPYRYRLTLLGSLAIWTSELVTSWLARFICQWTMDVDTTNLGLDELREYPDLMATVIWTSVHVLMDMLLFLIKLNFR